MILWIQGPGVRLWYGALQRMFGSGGKPKQALKKVVLDQFLFAPALIASILTVVPLASGQSLQQAQAKLDQDYWSVLKANYQVLFFVVATCQLFIF
jgi:Mpv17 / PMP22 family